MTILSFPPNMLGGNCARDSTQNNEEGVVAVVEFLSAFTLFLMILTAFMSLAQLELGSNDPYSDLIDRSAVDGLDRLTNGEGWFVPYNDGVRDQANSTKDWHKIPVVDLYSGVLQPGIVSNGVLDLDRVQALSNVTIEAMTGGLGLSDELQVRLLIQVENSNNSERVGEVLFDGGSDRSTATTSSVASRSFISGNEVISVSLEVHDGGKAPKVLRITEISPRPSGGSPEWIEVQNYNGFALSLKGWSFERSGTSGSSDYLYKEGVVPGGGTALVRAIESLEKLKGDNEDQNVGINIAKRALESPLRQIASNAGEESSVIVAEVRDGKGALGFNAATGEYGDMIEMGILDPAKVTRTALQAAGSVAGMMITTEAMVTDIPKDDSASPAMPDMGGMGGMPGMM